FSPGAFQWPALLETGIGVDAGDRAGLCHPFPSCRGSQNGPRREGFASPRNTGAPLTAAGRSERTPPSKRERGRVKSNQTTAVLAPFSTAIDMAVVAPKSLTRDIQGMGRVWSIPESRAKRSL